MYNKDTSWVVDKYYYIIYFKDFLKPTLFPVYFTSRAAAKRAIKFKIKSPKLRSLYQVIRGKKLHDFNMTYILKLGRFQYFPKYQFPREIKTDQQKKSYRTMIRRRLRRMGMFTSNRKNKVFVQDKSPVVKRIHNKQWIAKSPETLCQAFRLERQSSKLFHLILKKSISSDKGKLFKIIALRVNIKTKEIKKVKMQIGRKDIILPHLIMEVIQLYGNIEILMDRLREEGIRFNYSQQSKILGWLRRDDKLKNVVH